ncbi:MAG: hypothetical protein AAF787_21400, partial [Chloroflexota bacterium]
PHYNWTPVNLGRGGGWVATSIVEQNTPPLTVKVPSTLVLELMTEHRGDVAIGCEVTSPTFSSPAAGNLPAYDDIPFIHASATYDTNSGKTYLSLVNRSVAHSVSVDIEGESYTDPATSYIIRGDSPLSTNDVNQPNHIQIEESTVGSLNPIVITPHTFLVLVLE